MVELMPALSAVAQAAAGFLLTYLVHSTLLCGGALLISLLLRQRALRLQEGILRLALLGSVVTACLPLRLPAQLSTPLRPSPPPLVAGSEPLPRVAQPRRLPLAVAAAEDLGPPFLPSTAEKGIELKGGVLSQALIGIWLLGAVLLLLRTARAFWRLRALLAERRPLSAAERARLIDHLPVGLAARLSTSGFTAVPLALGILRPEICLPRRALTDLNRELLRGALLHEAAHLLRRDPAWRIFGRLLGCLLWPQLLLHLVLRRLHALAEYLCDDFSATRTGRPLVLARCLTEVAGWLDSEAEAATVPGMLQTESELARRVGRLLCWEDRSDPMRKNTILIPMGGALLLLVACAAPRFVISQAAAAPEANPALVAEAAEVPPPAAPQPPAAAAAPSAKPPTVAAPPRVSLSRRPPRPPAPPAPPAEVNSEDESGKTLSQKAAALGEAARNGDHDAMARLEREIEVLAEGNVQRALSALEHAQMTVDEQAGSHPLGREIAETVRQAMRDAKEQIRQARRGLIERARQERELARQEREQEREQERHEGREEEPDPAAQTGWVKLEAERAQLEADRARLQAERAQLRAERAQLEATRRALHDPAAPPAAAPAP